MTLTDLKHQLIQGKAQSFILLDAEYTAWQDSANSKWSKDNEYPELVQLAALKVNINSFELEDSFEQFVMPIINPVLSDYFMELTGISQAEVDEKGVACQQALDGFRQFAKDLPVWCYGSDDKILQYNQFLYDLPKAAPFVFHDISWLIKQLGDDFTQYTSGSLYQAAGVTFEGTLHNALDDCKSMLLYLQSHFQSAS